MALYLRNKIYWYKRRTPSLLHAEFGKTDYRVSLRTSSRAEAEIRAQEVSRELDAFWEPLKIKAQQSYRAEKHLRAAARMMNLPYIHFSRMMRDPEQVAQRLNDMPNNPTEVETLAALGLSEDEELKLSSLFYQVEEIKQFDNRGKAPDQIRKWRNPRIKALRNLVEVVGDMPLKSFDRSHALELKQVLTERVQKGEIKAASANKDISYLRSMWNEVNDEKMLGLPAVFSGLRFKNAETGKRPAFSDAWIRNVLLKPDAFDKLNDEARDVFLVCVNTGCRPGEIANLTPEQIKLDHNVPHVSIQPVGREVKSRRAIRDIPLVGVSLEAMRRHPDGFPRYRGKADHLSNLLNDYMRDNGLKETPQHVTYSLRHSFEDRLTAADVGERVDRDLMGHSLGREEYGEGASLEQKLDVLSKISYS